MELESPGSPLRFSRALLVGIAVAILALVAAAALALLNPDGLTRAPGTKGKDASALPELKQAKWHVDRRIVGPQQGKAKATVLRLQAAAAADVVQQLYEGLLVEPDGAIGGLVSKKAAAALERSKIATARDLERVQTLRRSVKLSIQGPGGALAAARVNVKLAALAGEKRVHLRHSSTLWLERSGKSWEVIAFEAEQRPIK